MLRAGITLERRGPRGPSGRDVGSATLERRGPRGPPEGPRDPPCLSSTHSLTHSMDAGGASVPCPKLPRVSGPSVEIHGLHPPSRGRQRATGGMREASDPEQGLPAVLEADT